MLKKEKLHLGMQGQFEIIIDPTDTDVSLQYTIKIDNSKFTESNDINLKIKKIILNGIEYAYTTNTITTLVDPDDPENSETITTTEIEIDLIKPLSATCKS